MSELDKVPVAPTGADEGVDAPTSASADKTDAAGASEAALAEVTKDRDDLKRTVEDLNRQVGSLKQMVAVPEREPATQPVPAEKSVNTIDELTAKIVESINTAANTQNPEPWARTIATQFSDMRDEIQNLRAEAIQRDTTTSDDKHGMELRRKFDLRHPTLANLESEEVGWALTTAIRKDQTLRTAPREVAMDAVAKILYARNFGKGAEAATPRSRTDELPLKTAERTKVDSQAKEDLTSTDVLDDFMKMTK